MCSVNTERWKTGTSPRGVHRLHVVPVACEALPYLQNKGPKTFSPCVTPGKPTLIKVLWHRDRDLGWDWGGVGTKPIQEELNAFFPLVMPGSKIKQTEHLLRERGGQLCNCKGEIVKGL